LTDNLELSVAPSGRLGYSDVNSRIGDGFLIGDVFSLFYDCGIISGISATELYSSIRQVSDFKTSIYPYFIDNNDVSDYQIRTEFTDSNDYNVYGLRIIEDVYSWLGTEKQDFIIVDYNIINESIYDIEDFYFGLFTDWDLVESGINSVILDENNDFMYCRSDVAQTMYAGIKSLSNLDVNNYALPQIEGGDGTVDITDGFPDIEKFYMISHSNSGYEENPTDVVVFTGTGPFDIPSHDTVTVGFAIIASESEFNINNAMINSKNIYDTILHPQNIITNEVAVIRIFPNPANDLLFIHSDLVLGSPFMIEIYNETGEKIFSDRFTGQSVVNLENYSSGLYMVKLIGENKNYVSRFIKLD